MLNRDGHSSEDTPTKLRVIHEGSTPFTNLHHEVAHDELRDGHSHDDYHEQHNTGGDNALSQPGASEGWRNVSIPTANPSAVSGQHQRVTKAGPAGQKAELPANEAGYNSKQNGKHVNGLNVHAGENTKADD